MLTLAASILVQVLAWPLVALLVRNAVRRRQTIANIAAAVLLAAWALEAIVDPAGETNVFDGSANAFIHVSIAVLLASYPDGRLTPRWIVIPVLAQIALQLGNAVSGFAWDDLLWWPLALVAIWVTLLLGGQLYRFLRRSNVDERRQASWPLLAVIVQMVAFTLATSIQIGITGELSGDASSAVAVLLNSLAALGFAVGLLAPKLFRIDRALRSVIAFSITGLVLLGCFAGLTALLPAAGVSDTGTLWIAGVAVAVLAVPLFRLGGLVADRLVYRGRPDPLEVLDRLGAQFDGSIDPLEVPRAVVRSVGEALSLRGVRLRGEGALAASWGEPSDDAESFPVIYQGEQLALLEASPRAGENQLSEHDRLVMLHVTRQAASALAGARAIVELIEARSRLVFAHEEERRRLRRDLHDDLAPTFAGLGMDAAVIREYSRSGDRRAVQAAAELADGLAAATRQIREIAYNLRPPVLDDQGLVAAIRDRVVLRGAVPEVELRAPAGRLQLPAAVESAALRIVQEAVTNVRRHAVATLCTVELVVDDAVLLLTVEDDGRGMPLQRRDGIGLRSIRERVAELGGTVEFPPGAAGTRIRVVLPLPVVPEALAS